MKLKTLVLAIATVITLAQSAEANECKVIKLVQTRVDYVTDEYRKLAITAALADQDSSAYQAQAERYGAVASFTSANMRSKGCVWGDGDSDKLTVDEASIADEVIEKLYKMFHD